MWNFSEKLYFKKFLAPFGVFRSQLKVNFKSNKAQDHLIFCSTCPHLFLFEKWFEAYSSPGALMYVEKWFEQSSLTSEDSCLKLKQNFCLGLIKTYSYQINKL